MTFGRYTVTTKSINTKLENFTDKKSFVMYNLEYKNDQWWVFD